MKPRNTLGLVGLLGLSSCGLFPNLHGIRENMSLDQLSMLQSSGITLGEVMIVKYRDENGNGLLEAEEMSLVYPQETVINIIGRSATLRPETMKFVEVAKGDQLAILFYLQNHALIPEKTPIIFEIYQQDGTKLYERTVESRGWDGGGMTEKGKLGVTGGGNELYTKRMLGFQEGNEIPAEILDTMKQQPGTYIFAATLPQQKITSSSQILLK